MFFGISFLEKIYRSTEARYPVRLGAEKTHRKQKYSVHTMNTLELPGKTFNPPRAEL